MENEKLQELIIVWQDRIRAIGRGWRWALLICLIAMIPVYYVARTLFVNYIVSHHTFPAYLYEVETKQPLETAENKIFKLAGNTYSGYLKIKNPNLEYGVASQGYTVEFFTTGGTEVNKYSASTYILPGSEKIIVFPRFSSDQQPTQIKVSLAPSSFLKVTGKVQPSFDIQRNNAQIIEGQYVIAAGITNKTPFTIKQVGLPILLYDNNNQIVGANYTSINNLTYEETRTFQFTWPSNPSAVRAEILPEVNLLDQDIYMLAPGQSEFDQQPAPTDNFNFGL